MKDNAVKIIQMDQRMICSDIDGRGKGMKSATTNMIKIQTHLPLKLRIVSDIDGRGKGMIAEN